MKLDSLVIENFKSIKKANLELRNINLLIGANGAGKTNFIQFFRMLNNIVENRLQDYIAQSGRAENILFYGRKVSNYLSGHFVFGNNEYFFKLLPTDENKLFFSDEIVTWKYEKKHDYQIADSNFESNLVEQIQKDGTKKVAFYVQNSVSNWRVYHFHDTSVNAKVKQYCDINDNRFLYSDASNLPAFLYLLQEKYPESLKRIEQTLKIVAPFFSGFHLKPMEIFEEQIRIEWRHKGSEKIFNATHLSDGTLRMICLITLLLQPNLPDTILIDEPELGLHPSAINLLADIIKSVGAEKQIICSTQSVTLLNQFEAEDIIVVDKENDESKFHRLEKSQLNEWLDEYAIGELWEKNLLGGRP